MAIPAVVAADNIALATEFRDLIHSPFEIWTRDLPYTEEPTIVPVERMEAKEMFIDRFLDLTRIGAPVRCP